LSEGEATGAEDAATRITIDYYYDSSRPTEGRLTDELEAAIADADAVVALTKNWGTSTLQPSHGQYKGVAQACELTHAAGGKFVLLCGNLPYDAARYPEADAIMCSYMSTGTDVDSTTRQDGTTTTGAFNANLLAAVESMYDYVAPVGTLPVRIPPVKTDGEGNVAYDTESTLYERGSGLTYEYAFVEGAGAVFVRGVSGDLSFRENARLDKLVSVAVDGGALAGGQYVTDNDLTRITLKADYLNSLSAGKHTLVATHSYGSGPVEVKTTFTVLKDATRVFDDVTQTTSHLSDITWLYWAQIAKGWDNADGTKSFRPYATVKRQDMAAFLFRLAKLANKGGASDEWTASDEARAKFRDVEPLAEHNHHDEIWWLAETGVSEGWNVADGVYEFRGMSEAKRCDIAAFLHRMDSLEVATRPA
jgi:hypothetical protein